MYLRRTIEGVVKPDLAWLPSEKIVPKSISKEVVHGISNVGLRLWKHQFQPVLIAILRILSLCVFKPVHRLWRRIYVHYDGKVVVLSVVIDSIDKWDLPPTAQRVNEIAQQIMTVELIEYRITVYRKVANSRRVRRDVQEPQRYRSPLAPFVFTVASYDVVLSHFRRLARQAGSVWLETTGEELPDP